MQSKKIKVLSYDMPSDRFVLKIDDGGDDAPFELPAELLPVLAGEYGEPDEFVGQVIEVTMP